MRFVLSMAMVLLVAGCAGSPAAPTSAPSGAQPARSSASAAPAATERPTPTATPDLATRIGTLLGPDFNGSALVSKGDEVLFAEGLGMADDAKGIANTPETRFRIGSMTKQFTAMAILMLALEGRLETTDPVCDYVDACPDGWDAITVEHLLGHSSGIADFTEQPDFDATEAATPAETVARVADIPLAFSPGESFAYSNTGYILLGMVIERASGMGYEAFLQERIFEPLGMADSGLEDGDTPGLAVGYADLFTEADPLDMSLPYAAGGLFSTILDLQRWSDALDTNALVDADAMRRFVKPLQDTTDRWPFGYAFGVYVGEEDGHEVVRHSGGINGFSSSMAHYPDDQLSVVLLTNREASGDLEGLAASLARLVLDTP
jgi:CubicO group peptidase (beta-lactamase class C family)